MAKAAGILPAGRNPSAPEGSVKPAPPPNPPKAQEIEALRAEVERANSWNERVSVCRDHVADIVDGPCVICALDAAEARADKLEEALREARDAIEDWAGYASDYFREKHDLAGDLAKIDALLRDQEEGHE